MREIILIACFLFIIVLLNGFSVFNVKKWMK